MKNVRPALALLGAQDRQPPCVASCRAVCGHGSGKRTPLFSPSNGPLSCRLVLLVMLADPVLQKLSRRAVTQRGVTASPVAEHGDVFKQIRRGLCTGGVARSMDPLTALWNGMNNALVLGDKATALAELSLSAQVKYGPVFDVLMPNYAQITASFSPLQRGSVSVEMGEYAVNRTIGGVNWLYDPSQFAGSGGWYWPSN